MIVHNHHIDLSGIPALHHLDGAVLADLTAVGALHHLQAGQVLLHKGDEDHAFYIVLSGAVRLLEHTADGHTVALKIYGSGDIFGLLAVSGSYHSHTDLEVVKEARIVSVDGAAARAVMLKHPRLALTVIDLLVGHVHKAHRRIREMAAERVDRRLARNLLHLCEKFGKPETDCTAIDVPVSQRDLAEFIGATVETVNRVLKTWNKQQIVRHSHKHIDILDSDALRRIAEDGIQT